MLKEYCWLPKVILPFTLDTVTVPSGGGTTLPWLESASPGCCCVFMFCLVLRFHGDPKHLFPTTRALGALAWPGLRGHAVRSPCWLSGGGACVHVESTVVSSLLQERDSEHRENILRGHPGRTGESCGPGRGPGQVNPTGSCGATARHQAEQG